MIYRKVFVINAIIFLLIMCASCVYVPLRTEIDLLFEKNFNGLEVPSPTQIQEQGISKKYTYVKFNEVWDAITKVVIQHGVLLNSSKDDRVLVIINTPPLSKKIKGEVVNLYPIFAILVEEDQEVNVYLKWMDNLHKRVAKGPNKTINIFEFSTEEKKEITNLFFDQLTTQIYAGRKWKYLYKK